MTRSTLYRWEWTHRWSSLICTVFLLLICITGLPLIFEEEIGDWLNDDPPYAVLPADTPPANLDGIVDMAKRRYPDEIVTSIFIDDDEPKVVVFLAPSWRAFIDRPASQRWIKFDSRNGALLRESGGEGGRHMGFLEIMLHLHRDLFAGLPGELFLGLMALLFVVSIISGAVLYAPFTRKRTFGTVRIGRAARTVWLDRHNLLGIVTLAWALTVGATGVLNEMATPLFLLWQKTDVAALLKSGGDTATAAGQVPVEAAFDTAKRLQPGMVVTSILFPGSPFGSPRHYLLWAKGNTPLTARLFTPVLIDAGTGLPTARIPMPWYLRALETSRPLHFGDYGGLPLKVLWALLDIATVLILGSGLYLWVSKRKTASEARFPAPQADEAALDPIGDGTS